MKKRIKDLEDLLAVQCSNGNWNYDTYMMGLANGMILAHHIITGKEGTPPYKSEPKQWLSDRPASKKPAIYSPAPRPR